MKPYLVFIFLFLFGVNYGQQQYRFQNLTAEKGVSQSIVYALAQDSIGNIWFASEEGVIRYNSQNSESYNNYKGLPENFSSRVESIFIDSANQIWIGGSNGLAVFDRESNQFRKIENEGGIEPQLIKFIAEDVNANIWLGAFNGLWKLERIKDEKLQLRRVNELADVRTIHSFDDWIIAGAQSGLYKVNVDSEKLVELDHIGGEFLITDLAKIQNSILVGTSESGLIELDENYNFKRKIPLPDSVEGFPIFDLIVEDDEVYIATDGAGLIITDSNFDQFEIFQNDENDPTSISSNGIYDIHIDRENILWIATYGGGVDFYNPSSNNFSIYRHIINDNNSLSSSFIRSIAEDENGKIWFGTKKGVSIYNPGEKTWKHLSNFKSNGDPANEIILSLEADGDFMWVGTYNSGAYRVDIDTFKAQNFNSKNNPDFPLSKVYAILQENDGDTWFGGVDGNLVRLSKTGEFQEYEIGQVKSIISGPENSVFVAGRNGIHQIDKNSNEVLNFTELTPGNSPVNFFTINAVSNYKDDYLLMATNGGGLIFYNFETKKISTINVQKGMPSDIIQGILLNEDEIWASTTKGLVSISIDDEDTLVRVYDKNDGLSGTEFNYGSFKKLKDGQFAFGGTEGATIFDPKSILEGELEPQVYLEQFTLANEIIPPGEQPLPKSIQVTDEIDLKYNENSFGFQFVGILHNGSSKIRYSWKLEGFEENWTEPSTANTASYTNIGAGNYVFKVRAANRLGEYGPAREVKINIRSPWYASPVAWVVYFLLFVGAFVLVIYVTTVLINKRNAEQQVDFYNNLTHEIRTPLTILLSSLDNYSKQRSEEDDNNRIRGTIKRINSLFEQMLTYQKSTAHGEKDVDAIDPEIHIRDLIDDFGPLVEDRNLDIQLENNWKKELFYFNKEDFDKVIFNLISNAIKYSNEDGKIMVRIDNTSGEMIKISVKDQGIGIPEDQQKNILKRFYRARNVVNSQEPGTGLGLMLVKNIAEHTGGEISFESEQNVGSTFTVFLKNLKKDYKNSAILKKKEANINLAETGRLVEFSDSKLLIVEDNDELRKELVRILGNYFQVFEAKNGNEGLQMAMQIFPDLIITDLIMPELDGLAMTKKIKSDINLNHIPIFMLTVLQNRGQKIESLEHGISEYLEKPIDINLLIAKIFNSLSWQKKLQKRYQQESELETAIQFRNENDESFIREIEEFILERIKDESFSVHDLCEKFNMSRTSLYMKLKNLIDLSPQDLIINTRLKYSKKLLLESNRNIKEVAYESGFSNPKYFSTSFKKFYGATPSSFRSKIEDKRERS